MPLIRSILDTSFTEIFSTPSIEPSIAAVRFNTTLETYYSSALNIIPGNYILSYQPITEFIDAFSMYNIDASILAQKLSVAIETKAQSIITLFQVAIVIPYGLLFPQFYSSFSKPNIVPNVLAIELATAIDTFSRSIIITATDPKLLGTPIPGPII